MFLRFKSSPIVIIVTVFLLSACGNQDGSASRGLIKPDGSNVTLNGTTTPRVRGALNLVSILPIGDSLTLGQGTENEALPTVDGSRARSCFGYRTPLFQSLKEFSLHGPIDVDFNFVGGKNTWQQAGPTTSLTLSDGSTVDFDRHGDFHGDVTLDKFDTEIDSSALDYTGKPKLILIMLGLGDIMAVPALDLTKAGDRMNKIITHLQTKFPSAIVLVASLPPNPAKDAAVVAFNLSLKTAVQARTDNRSFYVPVYETLASQGFASDNSNFYVYPATTTIDSYHASAQGYAKIAAVIMNSIQALSNLSNL